MIVCSELPPKDKDEELRHIQEYEEMRRSYEKRGLFQTNTSLKRIINI
jgi:hypothetical protein